jgi:hypothetical protein
MRQRRWLELIKDYELEIHYHPIKQMLLPMPSAVKSTGITSWFRLSHQMVIRRSLVFGSFHMVRYITSLSSQLSRKILSMHRKHTSGWVNKEKVTLGVKQNVFMKMPMEYYGSRTVWWFQKISNSIERLWMKHIALGILFILEQTRCIKVCRRIIGGLE